MIFYWKYYLLFYLLNIFNLNKFNKYHSPSSSRWAIRPFYYPYSLFFLEFPPLMNRSQILKLLSSANPDHMPTTDPSFGCIIARTVKMISILALESCKLFFKDINISLSMRFLQRKRCYILQKKLLHWPTC